MTISRHLRAAALLALATPLAAGAQQIRFPAGVPQYAVACSGGRIVVTFDAARAFVPVGDHAVAPDEGKGVQVSFVHAPGAECAAQPDYAARTVVVASGPAQVVEPPARSATVTAPAAVASTTGADGGGVATKKAAASAALADRLGAEKAVVYERKLAATERPQEVVETLRNLGVAGAEVVGDVVQVRDLLANYSVNYSIPDSPGLHIVGLGTEEVVRPTTPRALALALQPAVDKDGKVQRGLALDFAPFKVFAPRTTKADYDRSLALRALWNTQVSVGTAKPADDNDQTLKAGIGVSTILFRSHDPLSDPAHRKCLDDALVDRLTNLKMGELGGVAGTADAEAAAAIVGCQKKLAEKAGMGLTLSLALATSRFSDTGKWSEGKKDARGGWLSASYGLFDASRALGMQRMSAAMLVKRLLGERVSDPLDENAKVRQSSWLVGAKLLWEGDAFNYFVEHGYKRLQIEGREKDKVRRTVLGLEWQVSPGLWLVGAIGGESGRSQGKENSFVTTGFKLGTAAESILRAR
jgi:hypothetical protein